MINYCRRGRDVCSVQTFLQPSQCSPSVGPPSSPKQQSARFVSLSGWQCFTFCLCLNLIGVLFYENVKQKGIFLHWFCCIFLFLKRLPEQLAHNKRFPPRLFARRYLNEQTSSLHKGAEDILYTSHSSFLPKERTPMTIVQTPIFQVVKTKMSQREIVCGEVSAGVSISSTCAQNRPVEKQKKLF